jgi:hypothetical protein
MFLAIMKFDNIQKSASRLTKIVEAWQKCGNISLIERDIALDELRHLYNEISALEICATETSATTSVAEESIVATPMTTPVVPSPLRWHQQRLPLRRIAIMS